VEERTAVESGGVALDADAPECRGLRGMHLRHRSLKCGERIDATRSQLGNRHQAVDRVNQLPRALTAA
jgi:hypothetical protein